jgi:hypothetical protein
MRPCCAPGLPCPRPLGCALMGDLDRQALAPTGGRCRSRTSCHAALHVLGDPVAQCPGEPDVVGLATGAARRWGPPPPWRCLGCTCSISSSELRPWSCGHSSAATGPGSVGLVVEVDADGEQHDQDRRDDPVNDQAERRPPASVGHKLAAVLPPTRSSAGARAATSGASPAGADGAAAERYVPAARRWPAADVRRCAARPALRSVRHVGCASCPPVRCLPSAGR